MDTFVKHLPFNLILNFVEPCDFFHEQILGPKHDLFQAKQKKNKLNTYFLMLKNRFSLSSKYLFLVVIEVPFRRASWPQLSSRRYPLYKSNKM